MRLFDAASYQQQLIEEHLGEILGASGDEQRRAARFRSQEVHGAADALVAAGRLDSQLATDLVGQLYDQLLEQGLVHGIQRTLSGRAAP